MSVLADKTEKKAIKVLAEMVSNFDRLLQLKMTATDAFDARKAENLLSGIIEAAPFKNTINTINKNKSHGNKNSNKSSH